MRGSPTCACTFSTPLGTSHTKTHYTHCHYSSLVHKIKFMRTSKSLPSPNTAKKTKLDVLTNIIEKLYYRVTEKFTHIMQFDLKCVSIFSGWYTSRHNKTNVESTCAERAVDRRACIGSCLLDAQNTNEFKRHRDEWASESGISKRTR